MYFTDEELQKWKVEDLRKYLLQRGVSINKNARKANLFKKVIFAHKLTSSANSAKPRRTRKGNFKCKSQ